MNNFDAFYIESHNVSPAAPPAAFYYSSFGVLADIDDANLARNFPKIQTVQGALFVWDQIKKNLMDWADYIKIDKSLHAGITRAGFATNYIVEFRKVNNVDCRILKIENKPYIILVDLMHALHRNAAQMNKDYPSSKKVFTFNKQQTRQYLVQAIDIEQAVELTKSSSLREKSLIIKELLLIVSGKYEEIPKTNFIPFDRCRELQVMDSPLRVAYHQGDILVHSGDLASILQYKKKSAFAERKFKKVVNCRMEIINRTGSIQTVSVKMVDIKEVSMFLQSESNPLAQQLHTELLNIKK